MKTGTASLELAVLLSYNDLIRKTSQMEQEQREFILSEYKKLIDAYDSSTNKYAAISAILRALADTESDYIYTADGYEEYKIDAVRSTDIYHIANLLEELK